jgi:predicted GNAT superfamily acetyltransferase
MNTNQSVFHNLTAQISLQPFHCNAFIVSKIVESDIIISTIQEEHNFVFPWHQWLRERPTVICYIYIAHTDKFRGVNTGKSIVSPVTLINRNN